MFNEISLKKVSQEISAITPVENFLPGNILSEINKFKLGEIDNLIIHGFPVLEKLEETPTEIRAEVGNSPQVNILKSLGNYLGDISPKGIESTIRFRIGNQGLVNEETWHGHYQYKYTVFYCLRGDPAAVTYLLSANKIMEESSEEMRALLLKPRPYFGGLSFPLISKVPNGYSFAPEIYDRSDFEKYVKDLDLPDVVKALEKISTQMEDPFAKKALVYLSSLMKKASSSICYMPGDVAMYREAGTIRFSPSYIPIKDQAEDRWLLAITIEN